MLLPLPRHLSSLTDEQLHQLWEMVTAPQPQKEIVYRSGALGAIAQLIMMPGNRLHTLDLSGVALCGLDPAGKPKLTGEYRSDSIELLCDAIESENCVLKVSGGPLMVTDGTLMTFDCITHRFSGSSIARCGRQRHARLPRRCIGPCVTKGPCSRPSSWKSS